VSAVIGVKVRRIKGARDVHVSFPCELDDANTRNTNSQILETVAHGEESKFQVQVTSSQNTVRWPTCFVLSDAAVSLLANQETVMSSPLLHVLLIHVLSA
jgi:hypothetical protein